MSGIEARFCIDWPGFSFDVDLRLPGKGVTALFGPSGSGKTTLLRCIAGLARAPNGTLSVDGDIWQDKDVWMPVHRRPLGYVFQEASLFPHLSVFGNLEYGMRRAGQSNRDRLDHIVDLFGIRHLLDRMPDNLSGGERSRVGIARALVVDPRLLLMDEPLAALDLKRKKEILPYLERMSAELSIPTLYVTHSPDEVVHLADHLVVMEAGRVVADGPLSQTLAQLEPPIRLGEDVGAVLSATIGAIDNEWHLARVDFRGGSFWTRDPGLPVGRSTRVRVLARDVSLAREQPGQSSIQNVMRGHVDAIGDDEHRGLALVRVRVGDSVILARLTRRAAASLDIRVGQEIWAQVKSVALLDDRY